MIRFILWRTFTLYFGVSLLNRGNQFCNKQTPELTTEDVLVSFFNHNDTKDTEFAAPLVEWFNLSDRKKYIFSYPKGLKSKS